MNLLFHKMRTGKKGQIVAVLTLTLVIFIIAAFIVVNLGKNKIQDNRVNNAAQAGVLAGGSAASVLLNSLANVNDSMILNFAGFTVMIQLIIISWVIDYVRSITTAYTTLIPMNKSAPVQALLAIMTLCITTATIAFMLIGATKLGNVIKKMIDEMNDKLPKNSRDSARQYAFSNAGVDEPKIPFSKSGCLDAGCYSLLETKFDMFMRTLPATNKLDTNYGASTIEFDWDDSRTEHIVNNKISVKVTPVQKVPLTLMKLGGVASESSAISAYLSSQHLGVLGPLIQLGVITAYLIIAIIYATAVAIRVLSVILGTIAAELYSLAASAYLEAPTCCWCTAHGCCLSTCYLYAWGDYYTYAGGMMTATAIVAGVAATAFSAIYLSYPPQDIPCFVWDKANTTNSYPLTVEVSRATSPASIDYGIFKTDWPVKARSASGVVKDGSIFPPYQNFDIIPDF